MTAHDYTVGPIICANIDLIHQCTTAATLRFSFAARPLAKRLAFRKDPRQGIADAVSFGIFECDNPNRHSINYGNGIHHAD